MIAEDSVTLQRQDLSVSQRTLLEKRLLKARQSTARRQSHHSPIEPRPPGAPAPLSYAQERLWLLDQIAPERSAYNVYQALRIAGDCNRDVLERCLREIIRRHDVFRTSFVHGENGPEQNVREELPFALASTDLSDLAANDREIQLRQRLQIEAQRPFDLTRDLLLRALLVQTAPREHVLLLVMHHIISDGWSFGLLFRELGVLYDAFSAGVASPLPELPIQYADYATWERQTFLGVALEKSLAYWREQLADAPALDLLTDKPRPAEPMARGATHSLVLSAELTQALKALSQRESSTLFMTLLAGFQTLLHRYSGQDDIVLGSCVAGRPHLDLEKLVGFFVNTLVLRTKIGGQPTFRELLGRTRETVLGAMAHQDLPFEKIVAELRPERSPGHNPFFQVMFVLQSATGAPPQAAGLNLEQMELDNGTAKFDLTFSVVETAQSTLHIGIEYRTDLFEESTIARLAMHFQMLLAAAAAAPDKRISELPLLTSGERQKLLTEWNGRRTPYPREQNIAALFLEQVACTPNAIALVADHARLTYRQLNERANRLAHHLQQAGAKPGSLVTICLERSADLVVSVLAIVKAGCAYVSLDPAYPAERLAFMLADTHGPVVLTNEKLRATVEAALLAGPADTWHPKIINLDADRATVSTQGTAEPAITHGPESLAYISYTSGSTGRPKGVCVTHRAVVRLVRNTDYATFGPDEIFLQFAPVAFDASTLEIWGALLNGGRLVVFPPGVPTLAELGTFIRTHRITTLWLTAGLFHQMIEEQAENLRGVRQLLAGGDVLSPGHVVRALERLPDTRLINGYGPTENTTFTCCHRITSAPAPGRSVPIGKPIANTEVYLLDANQQPVPIGVPGELYAGGDGLSPGYLHRLDLNTEKFVPHPFDPTPGARLYRTGDRARWLPDGTIEFLGRADRQVKIRGFRIEPGEIEAVLEQHGDVQQAVVVATGAAGGDRRLVAYVVGRPPARPASAQLQQYLQTRLPEYLQPALYVVLDELPLNANGKVDRDALPAPDQAADRPPAVAPRTSTEARLAAIWEKILGVSPVGVFDNFFALGGHSMAGVRLIAQIERAFGRRLPLASLFQAPTVEQLARQILAPDAGGCSSLVSLQPQGTRAPIFFVHGAGGGNLWTYANLVPHLGADQPIYALESRGMRGKPEFDTVEEMAEHYIAEIRTVRPQGPYHLGGYCFGGNIAYEMACQLEAQGEQVALLTLLDSAASNSTYQRIPWWQPSYYARFLANSAYWLSDFIDQPVADRVRFLRRKMRIGTRKVMRSFRRDWNGEPDQLDIESVIDVALFPEIELQLWQAHLRALRAYRPRPYRGRITLFRTRGHPFFSSLDPNFGWATLAHGGIDLVSIPGAHERIFMEPHVRALCAALRGRLEQSPGLSPNQSPYHS